MLCHVCGEPAIGQCRLCHQFHCAKHGRLFCVHCRDQELVAAGPAAHAEATAEQPDVPPPAPAGAAAVVGQCRRCNRPASRTCPLCGALFCTDHRGWREVRIGRYKLRRPVCKRCAAAAARLPALLLWLIALLIAGVVSVVVYVLLTWD
jgi:hypothetical protein